VTRVEVARVVARTSMIDPPSDLAFWLSVPVEQRVGALAQMRREFEGWTDEDEPGLPRTARVLRPA
jgi:hypothetical protein